MDENLPVTAMRTLEELVDRSLVTERMIATLSSAFGSVATLLAVIGLYGVMAFTVARRTREIGIRISLGAQANNVVGMMMREVALVMFAGIAIAIPAYIAAPDTFDHNFSASSPVIRYISPPQHCSCLSSACWRAIFPRAARFVWTPCEYCAASDGPCRCFKTSDNPPVRAPRCEYGIGLQIRSVASNNRMIKVCTFRGALLWIRCGTRTRSFTKPT
jgi:hypothetical protein